MLPLESQYNTKQLGGAHLCNGATPKLKEVNDKLRVNILKKKRWLYIYWCENKLNLNLKKLKLSWGWSETWFIRISRKKV